MNRRRVRPTSQIGTTAILIALTLWMVPVSPVSADSVRYTYDKLDRLIQEAYDDGAVIDYSYDAAGNRLSKEVASAGQGITLVSPNGGEHWKGGDTVSIRWSYGSRAGTAVRIELLKGSRLKTVISASASIGSDGAGSLDWMVPISQTPGKDYTVKVSSLSRPALSDTTSGSITVDGPSEIEVTAPDAGAEWMSGTAATLKWTWSGDPLSTVRLELFKGDGLVAVLADALPIGAKGRGSFVWTIPANLAPGRDYRVRVSTPIEGVAGTSSPFAVLGGIEVKDQGWCQAGTSERIRWKYIGDPGKLVKIELMKGGALHSVIASSVPAGIDGEGSYNWFVSGAQPGGSDYRIRITGISNSAWTGTTESPFTIDPSSIEVDYPNGLEQLPAGSTCQIGWSTSGSPGATVKIELLKEGSLHSLIASSVPVGSEGKGWHTWVIPESHPGGSDYTIRVSSNEIPSFCDTSDNAFSMAPVGMKLSSPDGLETWRSGEKATIIWSHIGKIGATVKIELLKGERFHSLIAPRAASGNRGEGTYSWAIPPALPAGDDYKVRVTSTTKSSYTATSTHPFTISPSPITIVLPRRGDRLQAGRSYPIEWSGTVPPGSAVKIDLLRGGTLDSLIAANAPTGSDGTGSLDWNIPLNVSPGTDYRIRVTNTSDTACTGSSEGPFEILPVIHLSAPNGSNRLEAGNECPITWTYGGEPGSRIKIELLKAGALERVISPDCPVGSNGSGVYAWAIPADHAGGKDYTIRIAGTSNSTLSDTSDSTFTIVPTGILLTSPYSDHRYQAGGKCEIGWQYFGAPGPTVRIELLKGGSTQSVLSSDCPMGANGYGSYTWNIPGEQLGGDDYTIRITSLPSDSWSSTSEEPFTIRPSSIRVWEPSGGRFQAGSVCSIFWSYEGAPGSSVDISLYRGEDYQYTIARSVELGERGRGSYDWTIPAKLAAGNDYRIMVHCGSSGSFKSMSNTPFRILASNLVLKSPSAGDKLSPGEAQSICWEYTGAPGPFVQIDLLKGGISTNVIAQQAGIGNRGKGCYEWIVPFDQPADVNYRIRVTSTSDAGYTDINDGDFSIGAQEED